MSTEHLVRALLAPVVLAVMLAQGPSQAQTSLITGSMRGTETHAIKVAQAQTPPSAKIDAQIETLTQGLNQAQADLTEQRHRAQAFMAQQHPQSDLAQDITEILALIVSRYQHSIDSLRDLQRLSREAAQKQQDLANWRPPSNGPPWSIQVADETFVTLTESKSLSQQYAGHEKMLARSRQNLEREKREIETQIRQQKEDSGVVGIPTDELESLRLQKLQANLKAADLELLFADIFLQTNRLYEQIADLTHQISQKDWQYMDGRFTFSQPAYERIVELIDQEISQISDRQAKVRQDSIATTKQFDEAVKNRQQIEQSEPLDEQALLAATRELTSSPS